MAGEDIHKIVETILTDKLSKIYDRLNNIESQIQKITEDIVKSTQSQTPGQKYDQTQQEFYFQVLTDEVQKLKMQISEVQTKTDRKLIESEKIRLAQENSLKNLSKQYTIQQEIRAIQQNLQNIVQITQSEEIQPNTQTINQQKNEQIVQRQEENYKQVYRTVNGKKYHRMGCEWLKNSQFPISLTEARQLGLGACFVCQP